MYIGNGIGNSIPLLDYSIHPDYGSQYGANFLAPTITFGNLGFEHLQNAKIYHPEEELSPMYKMKYFLDNVWYSQGKSLPNIGNTEEEKYEIKEFFIKKYSVEFVDNISNSDLSIKIFANTRKIGSTKNEYGIYQVYSDANIYLEKNGEKITEISVNDIKGADFSSFNQAGNKSLEKLSKTFLKKTLPAIVDILIKSNW